MKVNLLAINVGNTRTQVGAFHQGKLEQSQSVPSGDVAQLKQALEQCYKIIAEESDVFVLMASVNANGAQAVEQAAAGVIDKPIRRVEKDIPIPVGRQLDRETIVGEDRLLNAAAAYAVLKQTCIVVDAGTAVTIDLVDGEGTFHGGAIAPGARLMLSSLHQHTAQLPEVTLEKPLEPIGHNTVEAMRTAVYHGLRGMVRELTEQYAENIGTYPLVIATGGDAQLLFEDYELIDRVVPDLTLIGLRVTLEAYLREDE
jgi:type III pantothenate kinase